AFQHAAPSPFCLHQRFPGVNMTDRGIATKPSRKVCKRLRTNRREHFEMRKIAVLAALSASVFGLSAGAAFADYTLNIMHINDWHSRIESNNAFESTCSAEEEGKGECIGGAARLVTAIADRRKALEGQNTLLLNGGDNFQGSLFYAT